MHLIGRWARVREWVPSTGKVSPPYLLDRKWRRLLPFRHDEWWRSPAGLWHPVIAGGAGEYTYQTPIWFFGSSTNAATQGQDLWSLSSAYTYNSAGNAVGGRVALPQNETLTTAYFFIASYGGTPANVNDLDFEFRNNATTRPGATLHASVSAIDPAGATGWHAASGMSFAMSAGTVYWAVVADPDGNGTDFARVLRNITNLNVEQRAQGALMGAFASTNGFSSTTSTAAATSSIVLAFSSGRTIGCAFTSTANSASTANRRGLYLGGFTEQMAIWGMGWRFFATNVSGIELYDSVTAPGGTPVAAGSIVLPTSSEPNSTRQSAAMFSSPQTLAKATEYRLVLTYGGAEIRPERLQIGEGADATLRTCMPGGGAFYWTEADGTTDWANDNVNEFPVVSVYIDDQVAVAGGASPIALSVSSGLR